MRFAFSILKISICDLGFAVAPAGPAFWGLGFAVPASGFRVRGFDLGVRLPRVPRFGVARVWVFLGDFSCRPASCSAKYCLQGAISPSALAPSGRDAISYRGPGAPPGDFDTKRKVRKKKIPGRRFDARSINLN